MRRLSRLSHQLAPEVCRIDPKTGKPEEIKAPPGAKLDGTEVITHFPIEEVIDRGPLKGMKTSGKYTSPNGGILRYAVKGDPKNPVYEIQAIIVPSVFRGKQPAMGFEGTTWGRKEIPEGQLKISEGLTEIAYAQAKSMNAGVLPSWPYVPVFVRDHNEFGGQTLLRGSFDESTPGLQITVNYDGVASLRLTDPAKANDPQVLQKCKEYLEECRASVTQGEKPTLVAPNWLPKPSVHHHIKAVEVCANQPGSEPQALVDLAKEVNQSLKSGAPRQTWLEAQHSA